MTTIHTRHCGRRYKLLKANYCQWKAVFPSIIKYIKSVLEQSIKQKEKCLPVSNAHDWHTVKYKWMQKNEFPNFCHCKTLPANWWPECSLLTGPVFHMASPWTIVVLPEHLLLPYTICTLLDVSKVAYIAYFFIFKGKNVNLNTIECHSIQSPVSYTSMPPMATLSIL